MFIVLAHLAKGNGEVLSINRHSGIQAALLIDRLNLPRQLWAVVKPFPTFGVLGSPAGLWGRSVLLWGGRATAELQSSVGIQPPARSSMEQ